VSRLHDNAQTPLRAQVSAALDARRAGERAAALPDLLVLAADFRPAAAVRALARRFLARLLAEPPVAGGSHPVPRGGEDESDLEPPGTEASVAALRRRALREGRDMPLVWAPSSVALAKVSLPSGCLSRHSPSHPKRRRAQVSGARGNGTSAVAVVLGTKEHLRGAVQDAVARATSAARRG